MSAEANHTALRMLRALGTEELNDRQLLDAIGGNIEPTDFHEGISLLRSKKLIQSQLKPVPGSHEQRVYNKSLLPDPEF